MSRLILQFLGPFQVLLDGKPVTEFESNKVRALLAYLATEPYRPHARSVLAGLLWPDRPESIALANLRYALSALRQVIGDREAHPPFLLVTRRTIQFNCAADCWCDATAFAGAIEQDGPVDRLERALELYQGDFLEGLSVPDSAAFDEWLLMNRERLERGALSALDQLAAHYQAAGCPALALPYAWRQVEMAPWGEEAHRRLMRLLALDGRRSEALAQYQACQRALAQELEVSPSAETTQLYRQIRDGDILPLGRRPLPSKPAPPLASEARIDPAPTRSWRRPVVLAVALLALSALLLWLAHGSGLVALSSPLKTASPDQLPAGDTDPTGAKFLVICEEDPPLNRVCIRDSGTGRTLRVLDALPFQAVDLFFSWSPDGSQFVFSAGDAFQPGKAVSHKIYRVNEDGSELTRITFGLNNDMTPSWSPDGAWIAFHRNGSLWITGADGKGARPLVVPPDGTLLGEFAWSPDSRRIAFFKNPIEPVPRLDEIWIVDLEPGTVRTLHQFTETLMGGQLAWSPDGREVLCLCERERFFVARLFPADGLGPTLELETVPYSWFTNHWPQWAELP